MSGIHQVNENPVKQNLPRLRRIAFLPNFITICSLFTAMISIVSAMQGKLTFASYCIVASMILDGMDGRVARLTNSFSKFGEQLDSLCDLVAFGVAPAIFVYSWLLSDLHELGWVAMFIYVACTALRLARFNSMIDVQDSRFFCGLPSPAAAANIVTFFWFVSFLRSNGASSDIDFFDSVLPYALWAIVILTGISMVSNVLFTSMKKIVTKRVSPQMMALVGIAILVLILLNYRVTIFFLVYVYWVGSSLWFFINLMKKRFLQKNSS